MYSANLIFHSYNYLFQQHDSLAVYALYLVVPGLNSQIAAWRSPVFLFFPHPSLLLNVCSYPAKLRQDEIILIYFTLN